MAINLNPSSKKLNFRRNRLTFADLVDLLVVIGVPEPRHCHHRHPGRRGLLRAAVHHEWRHDSKSAVVVVIIRPPSLKNLETFE